VCALVGIVLVSDISLSGVKTPVSSRKSVKNYLFYHYQKAVGAGSPTRIAGNQQSQKPAPTQRTIIIYILIKAVGAGSPTRIAGNQQSQKPAPTQRTIIIYINIRCKFLVEVGDWWGGAGLFRLLVIVIYCG